MTRFQRLTAATAVMTYLLVVIGAIVRGTGSGLGCPDWPLCYGQLLPSLGDDKAWIEWTHRTVAAVIGLMALAVAVVAVARYRSWRSVAVGSVAGVLLVGIQATLGKITVETGNAGEWVTAHLAAAMVLLALMSFLAIRVHYPPRLPRRGGSQRFTVLASFAAAAVFALLLFGAHVTATGASLVFPDWPLFGGSLVPAFSPDPTLAALQMSHFVHRFVAALVGLILIGVAFIAWRRRDSDWAPAAGRDRLVALITTATALYAIQVFVGALQIFTTLAWWAVALHLALAAAIWALLAAAAVYSYLEARSAAATTDVAPMGRAGRTAPTQRSSPGMGVSTAVATRIGGDTPAADTAAVASDAVPTRGAKVRAYIALTKPRIIELLLVTTVPAMVVAARGIPPLDLVLFTLVGGALAAGSANAINMYLEQDIDQLMTRTRRRPLPSHEVDPEDALVFGLALGVIAFAELALLVNLVAAFLTLVAILFYVVIYTMLLKRSTPQNIVIGGAAGSLPPVIGWAAVTGDITLPSLVLFAVVFYWTPPHFWALALRIRNDYRAARVPMLPVVRGVAETTHQIALYSILMVALTLVFFVVARMGLIYLAGALLLGGLFLFQAIAMWRDGTDRRAVRLYKYSITYLTGLFAVMIVDVLVPVAL